MIKAKSVPRQVRKKYKPVNGCSQRPSLLQILSLCIMIVIIVLQAIIMDSIISISNSILFTLVAFSYGLLVLVAYDYVKLVSIDPVDPRLLELPFEQRNNDRNMLTWCGVCKADVHRFSYHCKKCNRCAEKFDHHCRFVNNCIGKKNYLYFFRIVVGLLSLLVSEIGQGVWVFTKVQGNDRWVGISLVVISGLFVPVLLYLAIYHCYISCWEYGTTLKYLRGDSVAPVPKMQPKISQAGMINELVVYAREIKEKGREIEIDYQSLPTGTHLRKDFYLF